MSIAEVERWLAPVLIYGPASVDEAAAGSSAAAHAAIGFGSDLWRETKAAPKKLR